MTDASARASAVGDEPVDLDLHGLVGIRLVGGSPSDVRAVQRQLGALPRTTLAEPDITIRFVPRLDYAGVLTHVGMGDTAYDDESFYVLRAKNNTAVRVKIPFESVGSTCEIVAETGLPAVPLLLAIVNFTVLAKGALPLHASTVLHEGRGILATGWSKGGKTETVLSLMQHGAQYVADEWSYISGDGRTVAGVPEPVRLWNWHLRQVPELRQRLLSRPARMRLDALDAAGRGLRRLAATPWGSASTPAAGLLRRAEPVLSRQAYVQVEPHLIFGESMGPVTAPLDVILLVFSHASDEVTLTPISSEEVAERMRFSLQQERLTFTSYYQQFRYAFPERSSQVVESASDREAELLGKVVAGKQTYSLSHPYPVDLDRLYAALRHLDRGLATY